MVTYHRSLQTRKYLPAALQLLGTHLPWTSVCTCTVQAPVCTVQYCTIIQRTNRIGAFVSSFLTLYCDISPGLFSWNSFHRHSIGDESLNDSQGHQFILLSLASDWLTQRLRPAPTSAWLEFIWFSTPPRSSQIIRYPQKMKEQPARPSLRCISNEYHDQMSRCSSAWRFLGAPSNAAWHLQSYPEITWTSCTSGF